jgi:5-methylcytosine-specific restriction protein A
LESHHIKWLSKGGEDTIQNTVALCPNCHRRVHALDLPSDQKYLRAKVAQQMAKSSQELKSATPFSNA